jgi:hypothetical protein
VNRTSSCAFTRVAVILPLLVLAFAVPSEAAMMRNEADTGQAPIFVLLSAADSVIPETSSCYGEYGQDGEPTVNDLLSGEMDSVRHGRSVVSSKCGRSRCTVTVTRTPKFGGSAMVFEFAVADGKLDVRTLSCGLRL